MTLLRIFIICFVFYVGFLLGALSGCREQTCPVREVEKVDHSLFDTIVRSCVNTEGLVDYGLRASIWRYAAEYLDYLGGIDAEWSVEDDGERSNRRFIRIGNMAAFDQRVQCPVSPGAGFEP
jgi:hypothetical protein